MVVGPTADGPADHGAVRLAMVRVGIGYSVRGSISVTAPRAGEWGCSAVILQAASGVEVNGGRSRRPDANASVEANRTALLPA